MIIYIEDNQFYNDVVPNERLDCDDFEILADKLNSTSSMLVFEFPYIEEVVELIGIVEPRLRNVYEKNKIKTRNSLPKIDNIFVFDNDINKSKKKESKKKSFFRSLFDGDADLWGLSKEDRRIAKEERMSPADYVEAEEREDDELLDDE